MNVKIADQNLNATRNLDGTLTLKRYDPISKFWVTITTSQNESSDESEQKIINILKKNYIERSCKQQEMVHTISYPYIIGGLNEKQRITDN